MRFTTSILVVCVFTAGIEARSAVREERNLLTDAISGVQNALGSAVGGVLNAGGQVIGGVLNAGGELAHDAIGAAEGAVVGAISVAEKLAEQLVHHNAFAVRILQCLAGAATRSTQGAADAAEGVVDAVQNLTARNLLVEAGGAVRECVVGALHQSVTDLQEVAHSVVGNASGVAQGALDALKHAIENNVQGNSTLLQSLDSAVAAAEQVVHNITQKADGVVDDVANKADDALDSASNRRRNVLGDLVSQLRGAFANNLASWLMNATATAGENAYGFIAQAEEATDQTLEKVQEAIDNNLIDGSDWEQTLETLLQNTKNFEEQLSSNAENTVDAVLEKSQEIADSISTN